MIHGEGVLARIARDMLAAEQSTGDKAYDALCKSATDGTELTISDNALVLGISRAVWQREFATAQLGLAELELRTADHAVLEHERRAA